MNDDELRFYTCTDDFEYTHCTDPDEAIESFLDECPTEDWPETLQVFCWRHAEIDADWWAKDTLDCLLEHLDEGFRHEGHNDATDAMKQAAKQFLQVVVQEYEVDQLKQDGEPEEIVTREWVKKNHPSWLKDS